MKTYIITEKQLNELMGMAKEFLGSNAMFVNEQNRVPCIDIGGRMKSICNEILDQSNANSLAKNLEKATSIDGMQESKPAGRQTFI